MLIGNFFQLLLNSVDPAVLVLLCAVFCKYFFGQFAVVLYGLFEGVAGGDKSSGFLQGRFVNILQLFRTVEITQNGGNGGGVTVAVLSATHGKDDRILEIALAVQQTHQNIAGIQLGINVSVTAQFRTAVVVSPFVFDFLPAERKGIACSVACPDILQKHPELGSLRNDFGSDPAKLLHGFCRKGRRMQGGHKDTAIHTVAVIHDVPQFKSPCRRFVHKSGIELS